MIAPYPELHETLSSEEMSALIAASAPADDIPETWLHDWLCENRVELRPSPFRLLDGGEYRKFDVVVINGVPAFKNERVQATLRVEIYDDGTDDGVVEVGLTVYARNRD